MIFQTLRSKRILVLVAALLIWQPSLAYEPAKESPTFFAMVGDLFLARPLLLATTVAGTTVFVAGLPFSAASGKVKESGSVLVVDPAMATFVRCLGCTSSGYNRK